MTFNMKEDGALATSVGVTVPDLRAVPAGKMLKVLTTRWPDHRWYISRKGSLPTNTQVTCEGSDLDYKQVAEFINGWLLS